MTPPTIRNKTGRPPKRATTPIATITLKIPGETKNLLIDQADAYDLTITEYLTALITRDAETS